MKDQAAHITQRVGEIEHLTDDQRNTVNLKLNNSLEWFGKVQADKESKQPFQDPAYGIDGVEAHLSLLKSETQAIFLTPPPKKEEPKPEEKPAEAKEGEKKEEAQPGAENGPQPEAGPEVPPEMGKEDVEMKNEEPAQPKEN